MGGVRLKPSKIEGIINCDTSNSQSELCEYVHAVTRLSVGIPYFAHRIGLLCELLELAYTKIGKRTKKSLKIFLL